MIDIHDTGEHGILELKMTPPVTDADYRETLLPALDAALIKGDRLRLLAIVEARPSEFTLGAMVQDARTGLKHWRGFDRIALVTDDRIVRTAVGGFSVFMPCPVATFEMKEVDAARRWLRESLGTIQQEDLGGGMLEVRLLIDLRDFDGWQGLDALRDHFYLVRGHAKRVQRAALVGDAGWQDMAVQVGKRAFGLDANYFAAADMAKAKAWLAG